MKRFHYSLLFAFIMVMVAGCGSSSGSATSAVEDYLSALVAKDSDQLVAYSCGEWEAGALQELDSFLAVEAELIDLSCAEAGTSGDYNLVQCTGTISTTYNNENREIDLSRRPFLTQVQGGDWRVCGYSE